MSVHAGRLLASVAGVGDVASAGELRDKAKRAQLVDTMMMHHNLSRHVAEWHVSQMDNVEVDDRIEMYRLMQ